MSKKKLHKENLFPQQAGMSNSWLLLVIIAIGFLTYAAYLPSQKNKFTNWDDDRYVVENKDITSFSKENLRLLTIKEYEGNYHPLTMLSYALNYRMGKLSPGTYILTNILLHLFNTIFVFLLVFSLSKNVFISAFTSIAFGIHPLHVESVAWISERKDVLYCFFFLLSLIAYIYYCKKRNYFLYALAILLFLLSLFSKGMATTLAVSLFLIDYLLKRKLLSTRVLLEKIPFFAIAIWFGIRAFEAQRLQGINPIDSKFSFVERISVAGNGITSYIIKHLYPYKLSAFYPYPEKIPVQFWIATIIIAIFSLFILYYLVKNLNQNPYNKFYLTGYLFFLLNIALVSQIIPVGKAVMADRYTYVSSIGILMMLGTALFHINEKMKGKKIILYTATGLWFSFLFINTRDQCKVWNSSISLWNNVIKYYPEADIAWLNRGLAKQNNNDLQGAISDYKKGIEVNPGLTLAWNNLGSVHSTLGKHKEALYFFDKAIQLDPTSANTFLNRANTKAALNDYEGAINDYDKYLEKVPDNSDILNDRALAHYHLKNYELAKVDFDKAIETGKKYNSSRLGIYYLNRGLCRAFLKDYEGAKSDYATALHIHPTPGLVYFNLGLLECYLGDFNKGCENLRTAEKMGIKDATKNLNSYCQGR